MEQDKNKVSQPENPSSNEPENRGAEAPEAVSRRGGLCRLFRKNEPEKVTEPRKPLTWRQRWLVAALVGLCLAVAGLAVYLWLWGRPLIPRNTSDVYRWVMAWGMLAMAGGLSLLVGGLTLTQRQKVKKWVAIVGALILLGGLSMITWEWWGTQVAIPIAENVHQEEKLDGDEVAANPDLTPSRDPQGNLPEQGVVSVALFGIDQDKGSVGRSDAVMIVSLDRAHNKIKLASLDRDSLVAIDGHGEEKLTHAWAYGQGKLAVKTLNQNFDLNITEYAYVNFSEFTSAIDYLGGVYLDITPEELAYTNACWIDWVAEYGDWETPKVPGTGRQLLNGAQALTYARNRSDGTGQRASRHREVLSAMMDSVKRQFVFQWPATIGRLLNLCHTTLTPEEIVELGMWALKESPTIETMILPTAELKAWGGVLDNERGWVRVYDLKAAAAILHEFLYDTEEPLPQEGTTEEIEPTDHDQQATTSVTE